MVFFQIKLKIYVQIKLYNYMKKIVNEVINIDIFKGYVLDKKKKMNCEIELRGF